MTGSAVSDGGRLRTADVVRDSGYSAQQVRDLERLGVVPPAAREPNGYRLYTAAHVRALQAYRGLARAAGPVEARRLLAEVFAVSPGTDHSGLVPNPTSTIEQEPSQQVADAPTERRLAEAAAAVGAVHVRLARDRDEVLRALAALDTIRDELPPVSGTGDVMTITQLAGALDVRTSTLRFWEQEGLVVPDRVTSLRARQYGPAAVREVRVVAALRAGGYGIPAVREVVRSLDAGGGVTARQILVGRLDQIATRTIALLRAGADLASVLAPE